MMIGRSVRKHAGRGHNGPSQPPDSPPGKLFEPTIGHFWRDMMKSWYKIDVGREAVTTDLANCPNLPPVSQLATRNWEFISNSGRLFVHTI